MQQEIFLIYNFVINGLTKKDESFQEKQVLSFNTEIEIQYMDSSFVTFLYMFACADPTKNCT